MTMKHISLSTTILAQTQRNTKTGKGDTITGVPEKLNDQQKSQALTSLKQVDHPILTDQSMAYMLDSLQNFPMIKKLRRRVSDPSIARLELDVESKEILARAKTEVLKTLVPLPKTEIIQRLTWLASVVQTKGGVEDMTVRIKALAQNLEDVPADITIFVIKEISQEEEWFPSWSAFYQRLKHRVYNRNLFLDKLNMVSFNE